MARSTLNCPHCNTQLQTPSGLEVGTEVKCPSCASLFRVPDEGGSVAAPNLPLDPPLTAPEPEGIATTPSARPRTERISDEEPPPPRWDDRSPNPTDDEDHPRRFTRDYDDYSEGRTGPLSNDYVVELGRWFEIAQAHFNGKVLLAALYLIIVFVIYLIISVASNLLTTPLSAIDPLLHLIANQFMGTLLGAFVLGPMMAGVALMALKQLKGEPWDFGDFFGGFRGRWYLSLAVYTLLKGFTISLPMLPGQIVQFLGATNNDPGVMLAGTGIMLAGLLLGIYFHVRLGTFGELLILDRSYGALDALKGCWELTAGHFWWLFLVGLVLGLINVAGALLCGIGLLFSIPFTVLVLVAGYLLIAGTRPPLTRPLEQGGYDTYERYGDR